MTLLRRKILFFMMILATSLYVLVFCGAYLYYIVAGLIESAGREGLHLGELFWLGLVGISMGLLATLLAWPFALSLTTLIEQNQKKRVVRRTLLGVRFFASLPLVLFAYIYLEVMGARVFGLFETFWVDNFASSNIFTQSIAFALTLLLYPLTIIPRLLPPMSVDLFFKKMLSAVINFAEVGLVSSVILLGLTLYVIPQMTLRMLRYGNEKKNQRNQEVILSLGGTPWESVYMTHLQSMREHFNIIVAQLTRLCFFEGLIVFGLLSLFTNDYISSGHWGATLSSVFVQRSMVWSDSLSALIQIAGFLTLVYLAFFIVERYLRKRLESQHVS